MTVQASTRPRPDGPASMPVIPPARGPFAVIGRFTYRRRRLVLAATALFVIVSAVSGLSVFDRLLSGGFADPGSESSRAAVLLAERFGAKGPALAIVVDPEGSGDVDNLDTLAAGRDFSAELAGLDGVSEVVSYFSRPDPALLSLDGSKALVLLKFSGDDSNAEGYAGPIIDAYTAGFGATEGPGHLDVGFAGGAAIGLAIGETVGGDLARAESIAIPITLVLLLFIFGSVVAATLPLLVAGVAIVGTFLALYLISLFTDVSIFALNLTTALGLGLAVDYSLFIVSRFREELGTGVDTEAALVRTLQTAGRTVAFSAVIVAASLAALLIFPLYFLRSFGYAGIAVVAISALGALFSLPALLAVLGPRINRFRIGRSASGLAATSGAHATGVGTFWRRLADAVMRRPTSFGLPVALLLAVLALPFLGVVWGQPDHRVLPPDNAVHIVGDELRTDFPGGAVGTTSVVLPSGAADEANLLASSVSGLEHVVRVDTVGGSYADGQLASPPGAQSAAYTDGTGTYLTVVTDLEPVSPQAEVLVDSIRAIDGPDALVGGASAELVDSKASVFGSVPLALGLIALVTFVLLFLMTGSLLIPLKALVLNVLSLGATFGAMVWIFQDGHGAGLLNFTPTGNLDTSMPILMFCVAFGLSMDYEVFLLSRIKEAHDQSGDTRLAVGTGLQRTGRIMTAAAGVLAVTFLAFATSGVTFIKLLGLGLTLAVLIDATLVRTILVPAFMRIAGEANWWAPAPLRRLHQRIGLSEAG